MRTETLGILCSKIGSGATPRGGASVYSPSGTAFVRSQNVTNNGFVHDGLVFIGDEHADQLRYVVVEPGDVVINITGESVARSCQIPNEVLPARVSQHVAIVRPRPERLDPRYLRFVLISPRMQARLLGLASSGATRQALTKRMLEALEIPVPPMKEQRSITALLGALDDKIELNRRMNDTLQCTAEAIFRDATTAADRRHAGDEFVITMGQSPPGETYNETGEGLPFFQGRADFGFRYPAQRVYCTAPTRLASAGDTLVSVRAPVGDINMALVDCAVGRGVAAVRHRSGSRSFTYYAMRGLRRAFEVFESEGTVFGSLSKKDFHRLEVPALRDLDVQRFDRVAGPLDQRIEVNERESRTLAALRDALLPKLISGELRIRDGDGAVEHAT